MKLFVIEPIFPSSVEKKRNLMEKVKQQQLGKKKNETKTKKKNIKEEKKNIVFLPRSRYREIVGDVRSTKWRPGG